MSDKPSHDPAVADRLLPAWRAALHEAGSAAPARTADAAGRDLLRAWSAPHRHYHDLDHLDAVLTALTELAGDTGDPVPATVRLAAWFHDAVHDAVPGQDERASADLARRVLTGLGLPGAAVAEVARLVLLTIDHRTGDDDADGLLLLDADLSILGAPPGRYAAYAAAVRIEYAHVPDAAFAAGRAAVLDALAERPVLFRTAEGRRRWEAAARRNLAGERADLRARRSP